jgi:hypothetical protein
MDSVLGYDTASVGNRILMFQGNIMLSSSRSLGSRTTNPWRWGLCILLKFQDPITYWCTVISQKNGRFVRYIVLSYVSFCLVLSLGSHYKFPLYNFFFFNFKIWKFSFLKTCTVVFSGHRSFHPYTSLFVLPAWDARAPCQIWSAAVGIHVWEQ